MSDRVTALQPRQWYRIENLADSAEVYVYDEISPFGITAQDFVRDLVGISQPRINLHLNTPGGSVFDGIAIYNALSDHPASVTAYIEGLAASIGTVIAMAGERIVIAPHARMMIHEAHGLVMGNAADMTKMAERLEATSDNIASIYAERAGGEVAEWRERMREETWYTDREAVEAGLADEVGRSNDEALRQAAQFDLSIFRHGEREAARLREEAQVEPPEPRPMVFVPVMWTSDSTTSDTISITYPADASTDPPAQHDGGEPSEQNDEPTHRQARHEQVDRVLDALGV